LLVPALCACRFSKKWLDCHIEACKTHLGGKPLVLQEYNMLKDTYRVDYYNYVSEIRRSS
jgi:hypothetical protein